MKLNGNGFVLRHFKISDAQGYFDCQNDSQSKKGFMSTPKNLLEAKREVSKAILQYAKSKPSNEHFAIEINGLFAGYISLEHLNERFHEHTAEISYCMNSNFRGRGVMSQAVKIVSVYAFKKYKLKRLAGWCRTFNKASARVLENAGFKLEGILRKNKFKDGKYLDDMVWAKVK